MGSGKVPLSCRLASRAAAGDQGSEIAGFAGTTNPGRGDLVFTPASEICQWRNLQVVSRVFLFLIGLAISSLARPINRGFRWFSRTCRVGVSVDYGRVLMETSPARRSSTAL